MSKRSDGIHTMISSCSLTIEKCNIVNGIIQKKKACNRFFFFSYLLEVINVIEIEISSHYHLMDY